MKIILRLGPCPGCGYSTILKVPFAGFQRWSQGESLCSALPDLDQSQQHALLHNGTHLGCQEEEE